VPQDETRLMSRPKMVRTPSRLIGYSDKCGGEIARSTHIPE
jgi:hypothetical protein